MSGGATLQRPADAYPALRRTLAAALAAAGPEQALRAVTGVVVDLLGDRAAADRPGALKAGERQFAVSAVFLISPDRRHNVMVAGQNFPPEQYRLHIDIGLAHPGHVVRTRRSLLLENTDEDAGFTQVLKTARMGSALYAPMTWQGEMLGQLIAGAQARHTYRPVDLAVIEAFADLAALAWAAHGGPRRLAEVIADPAGGSGDAPPQPAEHQQTGH